MVRRAHTNRLAWKLIVALIAFSSLVTLVTTGIQLNAEYRRDIKMNEFHFMQVERGYLHSIAENVWEVDRERLALLVNGIVAFPEFRYVAVREVGGKVLAQAGRAGGDKSIKKVYPLDYRFRGKDEKIGELEVVSSLDDVYGKTIERIGLILISNGFKTFLVAIFLFFVIHWLVIRHLADIADFAEKISLSAPIRRFQLRRGGWCGQKDELDQLAHALDGMQVRLSETYKEKLQSDQDFRNIFENLTDTFYRTNLDGEIVMVSPSVRELLGYEVDEFLGRPMSDFYRDPEERTKFLAALEANDGRVSGYEIGMRHKNGREIWVSASSHFFRDDKGQVAGVEGTARDITNRRRMEREIDASQARLRQIIQIAPEAIITISADSIITLFNEGAERIFGYHLDEIVGKPLEVLMPNRFRNGHATHVMAFMRSDETYRLMDARQEVVGLRKDGSEFPAAASVSKTQLGDEIFFTVMLHDTSDRRAAEESRRKALELAEKANRAKAEFMASMSHELRTPLNSILGFADVIGNQYLGPVGDERYLGYARDIAFSGQQLLELINQILEIERIEAGKFELSKEEIDLIDLLQECERMLRARAEARNLTLEFDLPPDLIEVECDRRAVFQAIVNIVSNALKFTPEGGRVVVGAAANGGEAVIVVTDTGIGIPKNKLALVKDPFARHESDPHKPQEGVGLGLAITNALVSMHGGRLDIRSQVGEGTVVSVTLPTGAG